MFAQPDRLEIDPEHATPLYHQVYSLIRRRIEAGALRQGAALPSEMELATLLGVSRITSKRALDDLEHDGFVARQRGRGTVVTYLYEPKVLKAPLNGMLEALAVMGNETQIQVLAFERVVAPKTVIEALRLVEGAKVDRAVRLRSFEDRAFAYYVSYTIPLGPLYNMKALKTRQRLELFRELGLSIRDVDQVLSAQAADSTVAKALSLPVGAPLLSVTRTYVDQNGRAVDWMQGLYRPDRFQYHMQLSARR